MQENKIPHHVGIIMDGNGRWATALGKDRSYGHKVGSANVDKIVEYAFDNGIFALTLYAFSSENWARPQKEVDELMKLLKLYMKKFYKKLVGSDIRLVIAGDKSALAPDLVKEMERVEKATLNNSGHILTIALNYGGRQEIVTAVNKLLSDGKSVTVDGISEYLYTKDSGEPDLIIRTGGEKRLSNFMLYQGAYSELYFTDVLWPDFDEKEFDKAIEDYSKRFRRFGKV